MQPLGRLLRRAAYHAARFADRLAPLAALDECIVVPLERHATLRYGENPHQCGALYRSGAPRGIVAARQLQGKELSFNNIADADAALACAIEFREPAAVIVKHGNPCGVAVGNDIAHAYIRAHAADPLSAFGGVVALNRRLDGVTAAELVKLFLEVIVAPGADSDALQILAEKPNVRLLLVDAMPDPAAPSFTMRPIGGGFLVQSADTKVLDGEPKTVTKRLPSAEELRDMTFAFTVAKHVHSNAIVFARDGATVGIGAGQMSRIDAARIAALKAKDAGHALTGAVMASDAFMPFPDVVELAKKAGVTAVIQPGGSLRDQDSIDAADKAGMTMLMTGIRHFRH